MASIDQILKLAADASQEEVVALIDMLATQHGLHNVTVNPSMVSRSVEFATRTTTGETRTALENMSDSIEKAVREHEVNGQNMHQRAVNAVEMVVDDMVDEVMVALDTDPYNPSRNFTYSVNLWSNAFSADVSFPDAIRDDEEMSFADAYSWAVEQIGRTVGDIARDGYDETVWTDNKALDNTVKTFDILAVSLDDSSITHTFLPNNFQQALAA